MLIWSVHLAFIYRAMLTSGADKPSFVSSRVRRPDRYRVVLRLAWATAGLYMPRATPGQNPSRSMACEVLPRCLAIKVARRNVPLPDPIFHGGQAQKLGHRLKFSIDITDKVRLCAVFWITEDIEVLKSKNNENCVFHPFAYLILSQVKFIWLHWWLKLFRNIASVSLW